MIEILATSRSGEEIKIAAEPRGSLMQALHEVTALNVRADCGGNAACATSHVFVRSDWTEQVGPPTSEDESDLLDGLLNTTAHSRLSC
ncbi:2Fe-2S iron-sulfur cluster-binding protein, partial [Streptomyces sp. NPDC059083]|uniref:2Fe-2S iron-sulfur cluster-binding protein n=1 Tax=Streptomyces sp. NPDC059083 TaxID=3346721 RepID=UPI003688CF4D